MTRDDPLATARLRRSAKHQDALNRLGRSWFAEVSAQNAREAAEFESWRKDHRKRPVLDKRPDSSAERDWLSRDEATSSHMNRSAR